MENATITKRRRIRMHFCLNMAILFTLSAVFSAIFYRSNYEGDIPYNTFVAFCFGAPYLWMRHKEKKAGGKVKISKLTANEWSFEKILNSRDVQLNLLKTLMNLVRTLIGWAILVLGVSTIPFAIMVFSESIALGIKTFILAIALCLAGWIVLPKPEGRNGSPLEKQLRDADDLGIDYPDSITKGELSDLISKVLEN